MDAYTVVMLFILLAMCATCVTAAVTGSRIVGVISLALAAVWVLMMEAGNMWGLAWAVSIVVMLALLSIFK